MPQTRHYQVGERVRLSEAAFHRIAEFAPFSQSEATLALGPLRIATVEPVRIDGHPFFQNLTLDGLGDRWVFSNEVTLLTQ